MRLLLFDIDGTLLDTGGAGRGALQEGLAKAFPDDAARKPMPPLELAGATDSGVCQYLFDHYEIAHSMDRQTFFFAAYLEALKDRLLGKNALEGRVLPGIRPLLEFMATQNGTAIALLTGNTRHGAEVKLKAYKLDTFVDFDCGAYGCDHWDRNALGPIAMHRAAERHQHPFTGDDVVVIGDTPKDIACGKAIGARTVAVTTGGFDRSSLEAHYPDHLLEDLSDTAAVATLLQQ